MPEIAYFLATTDHPISQTHPWWNRPLPTSRLGQTEPSQPLDTTAVTYGGYFSAVSRFCAASRWQRVLQAASHKMGHPLSENDLERVAIFLEKHGSFYHPARIVVTAGKKHISLVVNVAATAAGRKTVQRETRALQQLNEQRPFGWLPTVYAIKDDAPPMFLGDWFDGFHEFHLALKNGDKEPGIMVWDGEATPCMLSKKQEESLYRNMAMILTACYDPVTTHQIFPWHHAAGDFVVRPEESGAAVKLITVRDYRPMNRSGEKPTNENEMLEMLRVFFLHLTLRMRLDRIDGVAGVAWASDRCLAPVIEGFFQGLDLTARLSGFPEAFPRFFEQYLKQQCDSDLKDRAGEITKSVFDRDSEERRVIEANLTHHVGEVSRLLAGWSA
jgi:hypothetical protein